MAVLPRGSYGDWMIWMAQGPRDHAWSAWRAAVANAAPNRTEVHRAWLNDPSLVDFNFGNMRLGPNRTHKHGAFLWGFHGIWDPGRSGQSSFGVWLAG